MAFKLSEDQHIQIFNRIKSSFSDFHLFDCFVAEKLMRAIVDSNSIEINMKTTKKVAERYYDVELFKTSEQKLMWAQIQLIFKTCYVLILSFQDYPRSLFMQTTEQLLSRYPDFAKVDDEELQLLLNFRNMVKVTLLLIPARLNKQCILKIAGRLEGSQNEYITGGGQKPAVTRRVQIYEFEGGISAEKRPDRNRPGRNATGADGDSSNITGCKRKTTSFSEKKVRMIRLPSDEIRELAKPPPNPFPMAATSGFPSSWPASTTSNPSLSSQPAVTQPASSLQDLFMSPLSALSVAASQMLNVKGAKPQADTTASLPVSSTAEVVTSTSNTLSISTDCETTAIGNQNLHLQTTGPISATLSALDSDGDGAGNIQLKREYSDTLNSFLSSFATGFSDSEYWKETTLSGEALQNKQTLPLIQREQSLGFADINFSEMQHFPETTTALRDGETREMTTNKPSLERGFSLGFSSGIWGDIEKLTGISTGAKISPRKE